VFFTLVWFSPFLYWFQLTIVSLLVLVSVDGPLGRDAHVRFQQVWQLVYAANVAQNLNQCSGVVLSFVRVSRLKWSSNDCKWGWNSWKAIRLIIIVLRSRISEFLSKGCWTVNDGARAMWSYISIPGLKALEWKTREVGPEITVLCFFWQEISSRQHHGHC
jgi:hypothetical protein